MMDVGRVCIKLAGRDKGKQCVIVDVLNNKFVLIDGETRRRKCNILHLQPTDKVLEISKGASHEEVVKAFKTIGISLTERKPKNPGPKPVKRRKEKKAVERVTKT